ncbi:MULTISPECIES: DUF1934 family protein [Fusobacterium]|uniref:DUF1934 family protein n=1 Tax=Fusobacterium TaxID=848 RepID=UPI00147699F6|nr:MULTISPECIES: DUF1934 family protein [Fusobacterium]NME35757.1 DUF1934 domain-containing protein [Fusobacterium sp. FSA-380-WT-3A]
MKVLLKLKTLENQQSLIEKEIKALKKIDGNQIEYIYIDELGRNIIKLFEDSVIIERVGNTKTSLILKKNLETKFRYINQYLNVELSLFTRKLEIHPKGFVTEYTIYQGKEEINKIFISIEEI